ncbi:MAG: hypothetical protein BZY75_05955 [SAR202 cluster bacterium Io17-Chloro-G7]|nr:MAG: hypothetical protein BZY75_05955 [SAR202 cluster bacterium Io17-Chloro-G7]
MAVTEQPSGPLAGLQVLDLTRGMPGALATMLLSDYGADVIKVEHPAGNPLEQDPAYRVWNRSKRSVAVDLKQLSGLAAFQDLARQADVILESFRPGVAERLGVGYAQVSGVNPQVVYCSITAYGPTGPWAQRHGYESLVAAASGIMTEQVGVSEGRPMFCSIPLVSLGTSTLALQGILAVLHVRNVSGVGQRVETSMYQGSVAIRAPMMPIVDNLTSLSMNNIQPQGGLPAYRMYPCADDRWVHIGCLSREFWDKLAVALDVMDLAIQPEFAAAPTGWTNHQDRELAIELIGQRLREHPRSHWLEVLEAADVPVAPVLTTQEYMDLPQVRHNGLVSEVNDPVLGEMEQVGLVLGFSETPGKVKAPAPLRTQISGEEQAVCFQKYPELKRRGSQANAPGHPLDGIKVLDFSSLIAGPLGPMVLSDLGADVVKVEPISGELARSLPFLLLAGNRGKRGIAIDMKAPQIKEVLTRLLKSCDVVVHNMRVGVAERLGIGYEAVRKLRPDVIYLHSSGYGPTGPESLKPGFDPLFQSMSGITARQGAGAHHPVFLRTPVCDDTNGMLLAVAALMAIYHRDRTGQGQKVDLSLLNTGAFANSGHFMRYSGSPGRPLADEGLLGMSAVKRIYPTAEGWILLACHQPEEWDRLKKCLGWLGDQYQFDEANAMHPWDDELCLELAQEFSQRPAVEWEEMLIPAGVPCVKVAESNLEGFYDNPQAQEMNMVDYQDHPEYSNLRQVGVQVTFSLTGSAVKPAAPLIGQHNLEILTELGFSQQEISNMQAAGCISAGPSIQA